MKKKTILFLGILMMSLVASSTAKSQVLISLLLGDKLNSGKIEFGLTGGFTRSQFLNQPNANRLNSFSLGFYFNFLLKKDLYLYTGVLVKSKYGGTGIPVYALGHEDLDSTFIDGSVTRKISYFNVPIALKYKFKCNIFMDAGVQASLMYKAYDTFINTIIHKDDLSYNLNIKEEMTRLDFGLAGGMGYKFKKGIGISVGARYYYGLVDIYKDDRKSTNSNLYVYAEIPIGANKAKKKAAKEEKIQSEK